jgi:hypothetical protein
MKKIWSIILVSVVTITLYAQKNFEGVIKYDVKVLEKEFTPFASFMPNEYEFYFKGMDALYRINGGVTASLLGDFVSIGKEGKTYMVNNVKKIVYTLDDQTVSKNEKVKTTATKETKTILGYSCKKYILEIPSEEGMIEQIMWVTTDIQVSRPKTNEAVSGISSTFFVDGIVGFPLQITSSTTSNGMKVTLDVVAKKVESKTLETSMFTLPSDYKVEKFKNPYAGFSK